MLFAEHIHGVSMKVKKYEELRDQGLRELANEALCQHYGLIPGVTLLRGNGETGVFQEILNYVDGVGLPWVSVRLAEPSGPGGRRRHFYDAGWEKVDDAGRLQSFDHSEAANAQRPKIQTQKFLGEDDTPF